MFCTNCKSDKLIPTYFLFLVIAVISLGNFAFASEKKLHLVCKTDPSLISNVEIWKNRLGAKLTSEFNVFIENENITVTYELNIISNEKLNSKDQIIYSFIKIVPPQSQDLLYYAHVTQSGKQIFSIEIVPNNLRIFFFEEDPIATVFCHRPNNLR